MTRRHRCWAWILLFVAVFSVADAGLRADEATAKKAETEASSPVTDGDEELYQMMQLFADSLDQIDRNYVKEISRRRLLEAAIRGMMEELDQYSSFIPPAELDRFRTGVENEFGGVGIQVSVEEGDLRVISPIVGSPAYRAGILAGDRILEIEGESTEGITIDEAVKRMKGKVGTKVNVKVLHPQSAEPVDLALERAIVRMETVLGDRRDEDDQWHWMYDDQRRIGYVRITGFGRHTAEELKVALAELKKQDVAALILDLRFNPGGLLSAAIEVSDLFIAQGRIVSTDGRNSPERKWDAHKKGTFAGFPMTVLVNKYSASASEIVAACLQDHGRAVIVGQRTWGKGSVQNIIELEAGRSALKLTTAGYKRPSGENIHRFADSTEKDQWGVTPNDGLLVEMTPAEMGRLMTVNRERTIVGGSTDESKFDDKQFDKALQYLIAELDKAGNAEDGDKPPKPEADGDKDDKLVKQAAADGTERRTEKP